MGLKPSTLRGNGCRDVALSAKPYHFLEGSHLKSSTVPTIIKFQRNASGNRHLELQESAASTSVAFLRDERCIVFGSICTDLDTYALERRLYNQGISDHDRLTLVNIQQLGKSNVLMNQPVRGISLSSTGDHFAVLTYNGYSNLQIWYCNDINQVNCVKIFEEKNLISHSTCCSFSPNEKYITMAVCSDYFTMRSRSHLVVRQVNLSLGKYGEAKDVYFADKQKHSPIGLFTSLQFSPDSNLLVVGSSMNKLYILCTKTWKLLSTIESGSCDISLWGIFHPLSYHELLLSCNAFGKLEAWQVVVVQGQRAVTKCFNTMEICEESLTKVTCVPSFAPDGNILAVGLSDGNIVIIDPNVFTILWKINPEFIASCLDVSPSSLCFSRSCQYLLVGYAGEVVTVWLLPQTCFTLQHFCRTVIISKCAPKMISKLPIPSSLKQYLLYQS